MKKLLLLLPCLLINCARFQKVFGDARLELNGKALVFCQEDYEKQVKGCVYAKQNGSELCLEVYVNHGGSEEWTLDSKQCLLAVGPTAQSL